MTKGELEQCTNLRQEIESIQERIERLRSNAERITQKLSAAPSSTQAHDELAEFVSKLDELERQLFKRQIELEYRLFVIDATIDGLPKQQAAIMRLRYIDGLLWDEVARKSGYALRYCTKIHAAAIDNIEKE